MKKHLNTYRFLVIILALSLQYSCTKKDVPITPTVASLSTTRVSNISTQGASLTCGIISQGNSTVTSVGFCWAIKPMPNIDSNKAIATLVNDTSFSIDVTGLKGGTYYYVRAFAVNGNVVSYGNQISFKTNGGLPEAATDTSVTGTDDATLLSGMVNPNELSTIVSFEYGTTTSYGSTISAMQSPLSGRASVSVSAKVTGMDHNTTYHFRVKGLNEKGVAYGEDKTFRVSDPDGTIGTMTDIEGNVYKTISIGGQVWMKENLKTTKFNDGTAVPIETTNKWGTLISPAYCWYGNNVNAYWDYGALYNWFSVGTGKLAPAGWHVPTDVEWKELIRYLGGSAGKMKEQGLAHWLSPNKGATNSSGFTALPAGMVFESGFTFMGERTCWWTATPTPSPDYAVCYSMNNNSENIDTLYAGNHRFKGFSVRCVKD